MAGKDGQSLESEEHVDGTSIQDAKSQKSSAESGYIYHATAVRLAPHTRVQIKDNGRTLVFLHRNGVPVVSTSQTRVLLTEEQWSRAGNVRQLRQEAPTETPHRQSLTPAQRALAFLYRFRSVPLSAVPALPQPPFEGKVPRQDQSLMGPWEKTVESHAELERLSGCREAWRRMGVHSTAVFMGRYSSQWLHPRGALSEMTRLAGRFLVWPAELALWAASPPRTGSDAPWRMLRQPIKCRLGLAVAIQPVRGEDGTENWFVISAVVTRYSWKVAPPAAYGVQYGGRSAIFALHRVDSHRLSAAADRRLPIDIEERIFTRTEQCVWTNGESTGETGRGPDLLATAAIVNALDVRLPYDLVSVIMDYYESLVPHFEPDEVTPEERNAFAARFYPARARPHVVDSEEDEEDVDGA